MEDASGEDRRGAQAFTELLRDRIAADPEFTMALRDNMEAAIERAGMTEELARHRQAVTEEADCSLTCLGITCSGITCLSWTCFLTD